MVGAGPGADQVDGALAPGGVERVAQGLAVDGDEPAAAGADYGAHPAHEALLEGGGVEGGEDAAEGVVGGDAVGQVQEGLQPAPLVQAVGFHVGPGVGARDDRAESQGDEVEQAV